MDFKVLESLMISEENLEVTNEGLFNTLKEHKQKREEQKAYIKQHKLDCQELLPKLKDELKKIVSSYKPKNSKAKMVPVYGIDKLDSSAYVLLFDENKILNQNDDSVYDDAQDITEEIYKLTEAFASSTNKYPGFELKAEVPDNYCIYLHVQ